MYKLLMVAVDVPFRMLQTFFFKLRFHHKFTIYLLILYVVGYHLMDLVMVVAMLTLHVID